MVKFKPILRDGVMVARCSLEAEIGVRIPVPQPIRAPLPTRLPNLALSYLQNPSFSKTTLELKKVDKNWPFKSQTDR